MSLSSAAVAQAAALPSLGLLPPPALAHRSVVIVAGQALHDEAQRQVSSAAGQSDGAQRADGQRPTVGRPSAGSPAITASPAQGRSQATAPTPPPSAPADLGQVALDAETIQHLHSTLRALPRPLLESLTRAFRQRFEVPEAAATIADRIHVARAVRRD
jgi:hypothetical protein